MNELLNENTFNSKPVWRNAVAIILGVIGVYFLTQAWLYHMLVQLVTMPKDKWIDPFDEKFLPEDKEYPNEFCNMLCNIERIINHQLNLLREGFGEEYCNEENDNAN